MVMKFHFIKCNEKWELSILSFKMGVSQNGNMGFHFENLAQY